MEIFTCDQGTPEWFAARAGLVTASEFMTVQARGKDGGPSLTRKTYMFKLAGEIVTGQCAESYSNSDMKRGQAMEPEARDLYAFMADADLETVGFIKSGRKGCSPDALVGADGMVEIKTTLPHLLIEKMFRDGFPPEHRAQCQGALWVAEREWIDLAVYWPGLPLVTFRAYRDEGYIKNLSDAVDAFNAELDEVVARVRAFGSGRTKVAA